MYIIGIDIGGTNIKFVLLKNQKILRLKKIVTPQTKKELIVLIEKEIKNLILGISNLKISGVGIAVPGPLDKERNLILNPPNLKILRNCPLPPIIKEIFKRDSRFEKMIVAMDNDANCFTLAEGILGTGQKAEIVFGVTLGTGIGGALVQKIRQRKKEIYRGMFGGAGEIGHISIKIDGVRCSCGNRGCLEEYASEKFIKRKTNFSSQELQKRAKKGEKNAQKIYKELGKNLGIGLANIVNLLEPEIIIIGGGIAEAGELIFNPARKEMKKRILSSLSKKFVKIKRAKLGEWSGVIGATLLIKNFLKN